MGTLKFKWSSDSQPFYTVPEGDTEYTLHTNKKMMKDSLVVINDGVQSYTINYANLTTGERTESEILNTSKKMMADNITGQINTQKVENYITFSSPSDFKVGVTGSYTSPTRAYWHMAITTGVQYINPTLSTWQSCNPYYDTGLQLYTWPLTGGPKPTYDSSTNLYWVSFRVRGHNGDAIADTASDPIIPIVVQSSEQELTLSGNLASMIDYEAVEQDDLISVAARAFSYAFISVPITSAENLVFPNTVNDYCYAYMFHSCSRLTKPPQELPAQELKQYCYQQMFSECTSLTTTPQLLATELANSCCSRMFYGCTSLTTAPALPATTLASSCYVNMFRECTALEVSPSILPATALATACYSQMFYGCASLTVAPNLPATSLQSSCYYEMFYDCESLKTSPALPATTLATNCYYRMFLNCYDLTTLPQLPAQKLYSSCYYAMFRNCSSIRISTTSTTNDYKTAYRIPHAGQGTTATSALSYMFYGTGGSFKSTPTINTTYYTSNEVITVSSS